MPDPKTIGFVFVEGFADWEFGLLSASAVEWFGARAVALSPDCNAVRSMAGFLLTPERGIAADENADLDAVAVIGSDLWPSPEAPDMSPLLSAVARRGGVVGGICGGTLPLARAGLFAQAKHTSNGRDWILTHLPDYAGRERYADVQHALADGRIISAPGSAPGTFAHAFLSTLYPERGAELADMKALYAREHLSAS
ncbi:DJ-1/PfpI family protein [Mesorhizobium sp. LHD-90]|uniref:DJ-1/PfpI family protein n=1 Tax=Mesorhizobium sp. LHD-90 TaxID=3071414 RepID=UPI0027DFAFA9|nr:DJ-1/PfpI family protein [Mesorhizobium sp. LHD-90]MDQ6434006.1 DJ-1/PfpI family protein [Mesorhizobium sp. LHD-90]